MDLVVAVASVVMGVVEGITEFLPISSTGHLIATGQLIGFMPGPSGEEFRGLFEVVIQLGAILAVAVHYRARLLHLARGLIKAEPAARSFALSLLLGLIPALIIGKALNKYVELYMMNSAVVACDLALGGLAIIIIERGRRTPRFTEAEALPWRTSLWIGCCQCIAIVFPGPRVRPRPSWAPKLLGVERTAATNYSFMLAIPTMFAATVYKLWQGREHLAQNQEHLAVLAIGFAVSFIVAWASVAWLLRYISSHTFTAFGWYRIGLGMLIAALLVAGVVNWKE